MRSSHDSYTYTPQIGVQKCLFPVSICYIVDFGRLSISNKANKVSVSYIEKHAIMQLHITYV